MAEMKTALVRFLRWSERYARTDMVYLVSGGFWLTAGQTASAVASFALTIVFANLLPKEVFGEYRYILSVVAMLQIPTLDDMDFAVRRAAARGIDSALIAGIRAKLKWGSLGSIASLIISIYYLSNGATGLSIAFLISAIFLPVVDSLSLYLGYLEGKQLFRLASIHRVTAQFISVATLAITAFYSSSVIALLAAYFIPLSAVRLAGHLYIVRVNNIRNDSNAKKEIGFGMHLSAIGIFGTVVGDNLNRILIWHMVGPAGVATYTLAFSPIVQIRMIINNLFSLGLPRFANRSLRELKQTILAKMLRLFIVIAFIVLVYILAAPTIFSVFFPSYLDAVPYTQLLSLILLFLPKSLLNTALIAHAKKKELYFWNIVGNTTQVAGLAVLLPIFGVYGVIYSVIITQVVTTIALIAIFFRMND